MNGSSDIVIGLGGCEGRVIGIAPLRTKGTKPHRRRLE
jgi:hypothetical protein